MDAPFRGDAPLVGVSKSPAQFLKQPAVGKPALWILYRHRGLWREPHSFAHGSYFEPPLFGAGQGYRG